MNIWTKKSIELVHMPGYLDLLSNIYVMNINPQRPLADETERKIRNAFLNKNEKELIHMLIKNHVFPVKDSYVGFLRLNPIAIDQNPITIKRIAERLYALDIEGLIREATRPKETNRQLGNSFKKWLSQLGYPVLDPKDFDRASVIAFLAGSDATLKKYAAEHFGSTLTKGIDFILKKNNRYLMGEAKFLTTPGGEQNGGFEDASKFINSAHEKKVKRIALLDGYIWLESKSGIHNKIINNNLDIFSALLLPKYIEKF